MSLSLMSDRAEFGCSRLAPDLFRLNASRLLAVTAREWSLACATERAAFGWLRDGRENWRSSHCAARAATETRGFNAPAASCGRQP